MMTSAGPIDRTPPTAKPMLPVKVTVAHHALSAVVHEPRVRRVSSIRQPTQPMDAHMLQQPVESAAVNAGDRPAVCDVRVNGRAWMGIASDDCVEMDSDAGTEDAVPRIKMKSDDATMMKRTIFRSSRAMTCGVFSARGPAHSQ